MYEEYICNAARTMAETMKNADIPMYGSRLRLPDRKAIITLLKEMRQLMFPAYFGDPALMTLAAADYAALLLERIETSLSQQIALALPLEDEGRAPQIAREVVEQLPRIQQLLLTDIDAIFDGDPAAQNREEIVLAYPGLFAIFAYRVSHELYLRHVPTIPRMMTEYAHSRTGIDIHPGAQIGSYFFIDHGTGIVVGETTIIGDNVTLYQGVTLGGTGKEQGKRHPTLEDNVMVSAGAKILGSFTIGENSKIGAGSVVLKEVPPNCTVVGVPGRIVKQDNVKVPRSDMDQVNLPDPVMEELLELRKENADLNRQLEVLEEKERQKAARKAEKKKEKKEKKYEAV